jgi:hypothetical protein
LLSASASHASASRRNRRTSIRQGDYYHEATIVDAHGDPDTVAIGKVTLHQTLISETIG